MVKNAGTDQCPSVLQRQATPAFLASMTGQNTIADLLQFQCTACRAELTVPAALAGIEGPCPSCFQTIQAPVPEARYEAPLALRDVPWITPGTPPRNEFTARPIPPEPMVTPQFPAPPDKNFRARLAISAPGEPLDDSWKSRHRDLRRKSRRIRKAEEAAHSFLESQAFRVSRVALILTSAGMLVWLFIYMESHQWRLPGMSPDIVREKPGATSGASRPIGSDANVFTADDDTEIPPAANFAPVPPASTRPLAGAPR